MKKTIMLFFAMLTTCLAHAQEGDIMYYDFEPDLTKTFHFLDVLPFDLDNDGVNEWAYSTLNNWGQNFGLLFSRNRDEIHTTHGYETTYVNSNNPVFPQEGDTLSLLNWEEFPYWMQYDCFNVMDPIECFFEPHYMGIRQRVEDGWCYGWIEASVHVYNYFVNETMFDTINLVIYRAAYCTIPDYPLIAGQTSLTWGIDENESTAFATLHPNPTNGLVTITGKDLRTAKVINALGQCVATVKGEGELLTVDISNLPAGIYFVNITDGEGRKCVRKVVKE